MELLIMVSGERLKDYENSTKCRCSLLRWDWSLLNENTDHEDMNELCI
jgi:hypothetical protein